MKDLSAKYFDLKAKNIRSKIYQITPNCRQNKAKGPISKRAFQEIKARKIFQKTNISYSAYQRLRNVPFPENLTCLVFLKHPFWDSPFCLIASEATPGWNRYNFYDISPIFWLAWCQQGCHFALVIKIKT